MIKERWNGMNRFRKRTFAVALATAVISTSFNVGSIAANAGTSARGRVIVAFEELPEEVAYQTLPVGGSKSDLDLPEELNVILYSEDKEERPTEEEGSEGVEKLEDASDIDQYGDLYGIDDEDDTTDNTQDDGASYTGSAPEEGLSSAPDEADDAELENGASDDAGSGDTGSDDTGSGEGSDEGESSSGDAGNASSGFVSAAIDGIRNTFAPVNAYAAEPDDEEESEEVSEEEESGSEEPSTESSEEEASEEPSSEESDIEEPSSEEVPEPEVSKLADGEPRTLEDVVWKLDRERSEYGGRFQAVREGDVFCFVPNIRAYGLKSDVDLPEIRVTIVAAEDTVSEDSVSEDSISENSVSDNASPEFDQFMIVGGVKVRVTAPEGVFPGDATLKVTKIDDAESNARIEQAVKEDMGLSDDAEVNGVKPEGSDDADSEDDDNEEETGAPSGESLRFITFDVKILDAEGNELQPDTEYGKATVSFSQAEIVSDYLTAPGEETEGKLGDASDDDDDDPDEVQVIDGDDEDDAGKKTLRIYHFDDSLDNAERLNLELDGVEAAASADTDHFSPIALAAGGSTTTKEFGDFTVKYSGAKVTGTVHTDTNVVEIKITPVVDDTPSVTITPKKVKTVQGLALEGGGDGTDTYITILDLDTKHYVEIDRFTRADVAFRNYDHYEGSYNAVIIKDSPHTKVRFIGPGAQPVAGISPFRIINSDVEMSFDGAREFISSKLPGDTRTGSVFELEGTSSLTLKAEKNDCNVTFSAGTEGAGVFYIHNSDIPVSIESGAFTFNDKTFLSLPTSSQNMGIINISGGKITGTAVQNRPKLQEMNISGGTLYVSEKFLPGTLETSTAILTSPNLSITGGNIRVVNDAINKITNGSSTVDLHRIALQKPSGTALGNGVAVTALGSITYGLNDCLTQNGGMLYLWYPRNGKLYSVTAGGDKLVYDKQFPSAGTQEAIAADKGRYAAYGPDRTNYFAPYVFIKDLKLGNIHYGKTYFRDALTIVTSDGRTIVGDEIKGSVIPEKIDGVYDRLADIDWEIKPTSTSVGIEDPNSYDVGIEYDSAGTYMLTATIDDTNVGGEKKTWTFYIPNYVPVDDMTLDGENIIPCDTPLEFSTANGKLMGIPYILDPSEPTALAVYGQKFKWTVKTPSGSTVVVSDGSSYTPKEKGNYEVEASLPKGKTEKDAFTKKFTLVCKKSLSHNSISVDILPEKYKYSGNPCEPDVLVKENDKALKQGRDYTIEYKNNIGPGTATDTDPSKRPVVVVTGIGDYMGVVNKYFTIADDLPTGKITIEELSLEYDSFQTTDDIAAYVNHEVSASVPAKNHDGTDTDYSSIGYIVTDKFYDDSAVLYDDVIHGKLEFKTYSGPKCIKTVEGNNYIYARLADGRTLLYYSSKCIVDDRTSPTTPVLKNGTVTGTKGTVTVDSDDTLSGVEYYYVLAVKKNSVSPNAATIMKNGVKSPSNTVTIPDLSASQEYTFYAVTVDRAGNISDVSKGLDSTLGKGSITGTIQVEDHKYSVMQAKQEIDDYYKEQKEIKITAAADNGVQKVEYFISDKYFSSTTELENEVAPKSQKTSNTTQNTGTETNTTVNKWSEYNDKNRPYLVRNKLNYIYVKITDKGGYTGYISSKGIWEDEIVPKVTSNKATPKDKTATGQAKGKDNESGIKYYYTLLRKETDPVPKKPEDVKNAGIKSEDGKYDLTGLAPNTKYVIYTIAEDKAGNLSEIKTTKMTTKKDSSAAKGAADKAGGAGAGKDGGSGSGSGGSNVDKRTADAKKGEGGEGSDSVSGQGIRDGVPYIEDATDGILIGRDKTSGWDRIEGEVSKAAAPAQVFVNMNGSTEVPADALQLCKDRDVTYYFEMNDDITWAVNGLSFTADPANIDFRVRTDTKNIPSKLVNEVADVYPHTNLTIEHDGEFGFTAILSINMGSDNEGMYANLYYYDEEANSLEFQESVEVDGSGRANFSFVHASDYTVILRGDALTDKTAAALVDGDGIAPTRGGGGDAASPKNISRNTGSIWLLIVSIISFLLCALILLVPDRKKRAGYRKAVA